MVRQKTSTFYFRHSCMEVWQAVTAGEEGGFSFDPISDADYAAALNAPDRQGKTLARVTDLTPGVSCAYELNTATFDLCWSAVFTPVEESECRMDMTEIYRFHPGARLPYLLSLLFLRMGRQHKAFRAQLDARLAGKAAQTGI